MINPIIIENKDENLIYELNRINGIKRGTLKEIHISDLHFGVLDPAYQYTILEEQFFSKIEDIDFDILSINGDIYDHKFMSNSDAVMYAIKAIDRAVGICRNKNATLILIHGTYEHDANQLKLFYHYLQDSTVDIRIVENIKFEYIKNAKILCIPELYGKGKEYYENCLYNSGLYDSVFMHGTIKNAIYGKDKEDLDSAREPVFSIDNFCMCRGPIISGHVHVQQCLNGYFYYTGSPYRWCFGEEEPKGFLIVVHDLDTGYHYTHFEEIKSYRYDTINLDHMLNLDPKNVIEHIDNLKKNGIDYIRVEFTNIPNDLEQSNLELLKNYYRTNSFVKLKIENLNNKKVLEQNQEFLEKFNQYEYILDSSLSEYDILTRYINDQKGYKYISVEELKKIIEEGE